MIRVLSRVRAIGADPKSKQAIDLHWYFIHIHLPIACVAVVIMLQSFAYLLLFFVLLLLLLFGAVFALNCFFCFRQLAAQLVDPTHPGMLNIDTCFRCVVLCMGVCVHVVVCE